MEEKIIFNVDWDTKLTTNPEFILREIGDECILVPVVTEGPFENSMLSMNDSAAFMWRLFSMGKTPNEVYEAVIHEYDDGTQDHKTIRTNIFQFVLESVGLKLLLPEGESNLV